MRVTLRLRSFCFAAAVCLAATLLSWLSGAPSSCFHLAIVICSLYGGRGAGLLSIGLAALSFDYLFLSPHFRFSPRAFHLSPVCRLYRHGLVHQSGDCRETTGRTRPPRSHRGPSGRPSGLTKNRTEARASSSGCDPRRSFGLHRPRNQPAAHRDHRQRAHVL